MPPGAVAPLFPRASPTCACQSSAATARPGAAVSTAANANSRTCNRIVILPQLLSGSFETALPFSVELLRHLLERRSLEQRHLGHRLSVLHLGEDANRAGPGICLHSRLGRSQQGHLRLCHRGLLLC